MSDTRPIAFIVGAGDYIGAAIAKRFAKGGFVVCLARRNGDKLAPLISDIEAEGGTAHGFTDGCAHRGERHRGRLPKSKPISGRSSWWVFNVGGNVKFPIRETTARVFRKVWEMACFSGFLCGERSSDPHGPEGARVDILHRRFRKHAG